MIDLNEKYDDDVLAKKCRTRYTVPVWTPVYTYAFFAPSQGKFMPFFELIDDVLAKKCRTRFYELIDLNKKYDDDDDVLAKKCRTRYTVPV